MAPPTPGDDSPDSPPRSITNRRPKLGGTTPEDVLAWAAKMERLHRLDIEEGDARRRELDGDDDVDADGERRIFVREPLSPEELSKLKVIKEQKDWLQAPRMTSTEVLLRVGMQLLEQKLVKGDVRVALRGLEVTRTGRPRYPVESFLNRYAFKKFTPSSSDWRDRYAKIQVAGAVILTDDPESEPQLSATLPDKRRLVLEAAACDVKASRTSAEHRILYGLMGRAIARADLDRSDFLAIAVPRNPRMKKLTVLLRGADRVEGAGIHFFLVNRIGPVDGFQTLSRSIDR